MTYGEFERTVPEAITGDSLWKVRAYRLAQYASQLATEDASLLAANARTKGLTDQLLSAVDSISPSVAEGYSRRFKKEKAHLYDYALGSAREARDWYLKARDIFQPSEIASRLNLLAQIVKLLTVMIARERRKHDDRERNTP